jgi:hypothetical protein
MFFKPAACELEQLRRRQQIDLGAENVLVTEVSRELRQLGMDIDAFNRPSCKPVDREGVSKLVRTGADATCLGLHIELSQEPPDGAGCGAEG